MERDLDALREIADAIGGGDDQLDYDIDILKEKIEDARQRMLRMIRQKTSLERYKTDGYINEQIVSALEDVIRDFPSIENIHFEQSDGGYDNGTGYLYIRMDLSGRKVYPQYPHERDESYEVKIEHARLPMIRFRKQYNVTKEIKYIQLNDVTGLFKINLSSGYVRQEEVAENASQASGVGFWSQGSIHPHIPAYGEPCLGNIEDVFKESVIKREFYKMMVLLDEFIGAYNPRDSAGESIHGFDPTYKGDEGEENLSTIYMDESYMVDRDVTDAYLDDASCTYAGDGEYMVGLYAISGNPVEQQLLEDYFTEHSPFDNPRLGITRPQLLKLMQDYPEVLNNAPCEFGVSARTCDARNFIRYIARVDIGTQNRTLELSKAWRGDNIQDVNGKVDTAFLPYDGVIKHTSNGDYIASRFMDKSVDFFDFGGNASRRSYLLAVVPSKYWIDTLAEASEIYPNDTQAQEILQELIKIQDFYKNIDDGLLFRSGEPIDKKYEVYDIENQFTDVNRVPVGVNRELKWLQIMPVIDSFVRNHYDNTERSVRYRRVSVVKSSGGARELSLLPINKAMGINHTVYRTLLYHFNPQTEEIPILGEDTKISNIWDKGKAYSNLFIESNNLLILKSANGVDFTKQQEEVDNDNSTSDEHGTSENTDGETDTESTTDDPSDTRPVQD